MKRDLFKFAAKGSCIILETINVPTEEFKAQVESVLVGYDFYPEKSEHDEDEIKERNLEIVKILKEEFTINKMMVVGHVYESKEGKIIFDIPITDIVPKLDSHLLASIYKYIEENPRVGLFYTVNDKGQITSFDWYSGAIKFTPETKRIFIIEFNDDFYFVYYSRGEAFYNLIGKEDLFKDEDVILPNSVINKIFRMNVNFKNVYKVWSDYYLARMKHYEEFKANTNQVVDDQQILIPITLVRDDFILWLYQHYKVSEALKQLVDNNNKVLVYTKLHNSFNKQYAIFNCPFNKTNIDGIEASYQNDKIQGLIQKDDTIEYINKRFILDENIKD